MYSTQHVAISSARRRIQYARPDAQSEDANKLKWFQSGVTSVLVAYVDMCAYAAMYVGLVRWASARAQEPMRNDTQVFWQS